MSIFEDVKNMQRSITQLTGKSPSVLMMGPAIHHEFMKELHDSSFVNQVFPPITYNNNDDNKITECVLGMNIEMKNMGQYYTCWFIGMR